MNNRVTNESNQRLPCRGCTRRCKNYSRCEGKPWRLIDNNQPEERKQAGKKKTGNKSLGR